MMVAEIHVRCVPVADAEIRRNRRGADYLAEAARRRPAARASLIGILTALGWPLMDSRSIVSHNVSPGLSRPSSPASSSSLPTRLSSAATIRSPCFPELAGLLE